MSLKQKLEVLIDTLPPDDDFLLELIAQIEERFIRLSEESSPYSERRIFVAA